jgi:hypothetical protein
VADQLIYESKKSKIYFYEDSEWNKPVLLKLLNYEFPTPRDISQFYNEFDIMEGLGRWYPRSLAAPKAQG